MRRSPRSHPIPVICPLSSATRPSPLVPKGTKQQHIQLKAENQEKNPLLAAFADGRRRSMVSFPPDFVGSVSSCGPPLGMKPTVTIDPQRKPSRLTSLRQPCLVHALDVALQVRLDGLVMRYLRAVSGQSACPWESDPRSLAALWAGPPFWQADETDCTPPHQMHTLHPALVLSRSHRIASS
jgi:hypothetical protein